MQIPHPIPYQGSKRALANQILSYFPDDVYTLHEPFVGSGAISLAVAYYRKAERFALNDLNHSLIELWREIIECPDELAHAYARLWRAQTGREREYYDKVRDDFNRLGRPADFFYLLARCVKGAVRYNSSAMFNQSPDNRRRGASPETMREHISGASQLLHRRVALTAKDYKEVIHRVGLRDIVYMDPPYQGVSGKRDSRYISGVSFEEFVDVLARLNRASISYIVSYDGKCGSKSFGRFLPSNLNLKRLELHAGRSTQATLLGTASVTYESLYISPALLSRVEKTNRRVQLREARIANRDLFHG